MTAAAIADLLHPRRTSTAALNERDLQMFARIGVPPDLLEEAHIERVSDRDARERFGIKGPVSKNMAGIVFPYHSHVTGQRVTARVRRDNPEIEDGKPKNKYMSAYGDGRHLYFPPDARSKLQNPSTPVVLVEAEKSVLALTAWARRTTTDVLSVGLGGCWGWKGRIRKTDGIKGERVDEEGPLPDMAVCDGRTVYLLLDSNVASNIKVQAARSALVKELRKRKCEVKVCELPQIEGVNGPDDLIGARGDDALQSVFDNATESKEQPWPDPENLGGELPSVPPLDAGLLPESLRPMAEDVADRMQVPLDYPAVAAVLCLAGATNRRATIQPKAVDTSWTVVPNLWGGIVAPPSLMKSPVINEITRPLAKIEADWRAEFDSAVSCHEQQKEESELKRAAWREQFKAAQKSGQGTPERPKDDSMAEPVCRRLITQDATAEKLHEILRDNPAGVLVVRDELSGWLATLDKQGREGERGFFLSAWNGDTPYTMDRIARGSIRANACCVSMLGGIQPARLRSYLSDALQDGPLNDGLFQRFQILVYPDTQPDWRYIDRPPNSKAIARAENIYGRLAHLDADNPLRFRFAPDAQELFIEWLTDLEGKLRTDGLHPALVAHLGKYRSLMPSLALLFELADGGAETVSLRHAQQAAAFCDYLESHARRIYSMIVSPERLAAAELGRHLRNGWKREEGQFTVRDVYQNDWRGLTTPDEVRRTLPLLEDAGWIRRVESQTGNGRPSEICIINPKLKGRTK